MIVKINIVELAALPVESCLNWKYSCRDNNMLKKGLNKRSIYDRFYIRKAKTEIRMSSTRKFFFGDIKTWLRRYSINEFFFTWICDIVWMKNTKIFEIKWYNFKSMISIRSPRSPENMTVPSKNWSISVWFLLF